MGPMRKRYKEIRENLNAFARVEGIMQGAVDESFCNMRDKLMEEGAPLAQEVMENSRSYERAKRRANILTELFDDRFFSLADRDKLADLRDKAYANHKVWAEIWDEL